MKPESKFDGVIQVAGELMLQEVKLQTAADVAMRKAKQQAQAAKAKKPKGPPVRFKKASQYPNYVPPQAQPPPLPVQTATPPVPTPPPLPVQVATSTASGIKPRGAVGNLKDAFADSLKKTFGSKGTTLAGVQRAVGHVARLDPRGTFKPTNVYLLDGRDKNMLQKLNAVVDPSIQKVEVTEAISAPPVSPPQPQDTEEKLQAEFERRLERSTLGGMRGKFYTTGLEFDDQGLVANTKTTQQFLYNIFTKYKEKPITYDMLLGSLPNPNVPFEKQSKQLHDLMIGMNLVGKDGPVYYMTPQQAEVYQKEPRSFGRTLGDITKGLINFGKSTGPTAH